MSHDIHVTPMTVPDPPLGSCAHAFREIAQKFVAMEVQIADLRRQVSELETNRTPQEKGTP